MMLPLFILLLAATAAYAGPADQASNFPVSPEVASEYGCGTACQEYLNETNARDLEDFDTPFDFSFYATADNFSDSKPGDVLKLVPVDPDLLQIPAGIATYKIQYTSVDVDNSTVPATAFIAFPFVKKSDPYKLVAFAHGTSGVFRGCAPSTSSWLYDYDTWIPLLFEGFAVVGTDYAGLGNNHTRHRYISASSNANDVYWSSVAARKAFPADLSHEWVSIGHSQGGGASWKLSESKLVQHKDSGYLGGIAIAPNTHIYDAIIEGLNNPGGGSGEDPSGTGSGSYIPSIYFALKAAFPELEAAFWSDVAKKRFELAELAQLCATALPAVVKDLELSDIITSVDPADFSSIKEFQDANAPSQGDKTTRPLLVIVGRNDTTVLPVISARAYEKSCEAGNAVHLSIYPELEHSAVSGASATQWLSFLNSLFNGCGLQRCKKETVQPFDAEHARTPEEE